MAIRAKRHQRAVLWEMIGVDRQGVPILADPVEIRVRWESGNRTTRRQTGTVDVKTFVGRKIAEGSVMWLGSLASLPNPDITSEFGSVETYQVIEYQEYPSIKGRTPTRNALLMRRSSQVPNP